MVATSLVIIPICYFDDGVGRYGIILFANSAIFIVCKYTLPGPVRVVRNSPSPPNNIFLKPFTVSTSYLTVDPKIATLPVSTLSFSSEARSISLIELSSSMKDVTFPETF